MSSYAIFQTAAESVHASALQLVGAAARFVPNLLAALLVLAVFWGLALLARRAVKPASRFVDDATFRYLIRKASFYLILAVGVIIALNILGVSLTALFTGLGLGGLAVGFALKDVLVNFVSGFLILLMRVFAIGDQIRVGDTEGTVEHIQLRATHIRTYDGRLVLVPNSEIYTARVTNNTASPMRRASIYVRLDYDQDAEAAAAIILKTAKTVNGVMASPAATIRFRNLAADAVEIEARVWTDSTRTDFLATASAVRRAILVALKDGGIALPDANRRVVEMTTKVDRIRVGR